MKAFIASNSTASSLIRLKLERFGGRAHFLRGKFATSILGGRHNRFHFRLWCYSVVVGDVCGRSAQLGLGLDLVLLVRIHGAGGVVGCHEHVVRSLLEESSFEYGCPGLAGSLAIEQVLDFFLLI